ncbi:MAG: MBOAT family protein [Spirochaetes bacterium]|nr:MBOAT family protein [Spirochaetota bacterium]
MSFHASAFLFLFLPLFLVISHALPHRLRSPWLLAASAVFYAWWRLDFLALVAAMSAVVWLLGRSIAAQREARRRRARAILGAGVALSLGVLAYFKYAGFGLESLNALLSLFGVDPVPVLRIALPVGISFSTFKAISYLVDVYRGAVPAAGSWAEVALYISIFPQVVSGPIDRFASLAPQFRQDRRSFDGFSRGVLRFMLGFCKKVLIADSLAPLANSVFTLDRPALADAWLGTAAYTMQLYFDFSGYSDMAIGLGLMMGLDFAENFRAPYLAGSITEFWKRWHISLSSWLRDYLYIPLGGNRRGQARTCVNLAIVMVLGGLWHGASLTFIIWGAWHGLLLVLERLRGGTSADRKLPRPLTVVLTMILVSAGWVMFRAPSLSVAVGMYAGMIGLNGGGLSAGLRWQIEALSIVALAVAIASVYLGPLIAGRLADPANASRTWRRIATGARLALLPLFLFAVARIVAGSSAVFLYGKF